MSAFVVWIDHEHARVFALADGCQHKTSVHAHRHDHHTHRENSFDRESRARKMFEETASHLKDAERILVVGPGLAKHLFTSFLAEHFPKLFRRVAGCEAMGHPTDPQITDFAQRYFDQQACQSVMPQG